uniref:Dihydrodipicolinate synthetase n=1 Tax=uncultured Flavobacteriia bacterium TaxID=212695 RepID=F4MML6_9BACT|nr:dihydrodipicolinate synthetase [uncultured Flavobacteriia bacterium]
MDALIGMGVALVTPFKKDGSVDHSALSNIVEFNIANGTDYLVISGTTAESATLTKKEKAAVIQTISNSNAGRLPMVIGIGGNNTAAVVEELENTDLSIFVAVLSVAPYYNKPTQEGLYQHFKAVAKACPIPVILYNVPGRTSKNMEPITSLRLANDIENSGIPGYRARIRPIVSRITIHWPSFYNVVTGKTLALPNLIALQHIPLSPAGVIAKRPAPIALPNSCAAEWRMAPDAVFSPYASVRYFTPHMVHSQYNLL